MLLVVPAWREADRIETPLAALCHDLASFDVHILVVDDGSGEQHTRRTSDIINRLRGEYPRLLPPFMLPQNLGKGGAVYAGWDSAEGEFDWFGFVDADGATPSNEVARLLGMLPALDADLVLASRIKMLGRTVERSLRRHLIGRIFATLSTLICGIAVYDSQCGLKFIRRSLFQQIRPMLAEEGFGFDMELIVHAARSHARILEVPVDWSDIPGSKVRLLRDSFHMLLALTRIRGALRTPPA